MTAVDTPTTPTGWHVGRQETVTELLVHARATWPDRVFLRTSDGEEHTYGEVVDRATHWAGALRERGVRAGDRVAMLADNSVECAVLWFAVTWLGAVWVPLNTANKGEFLRHQVADAGAAVVVADDALAERVAALADQLPEVTTLITRTGAVAVPGGLTGATFADLDAGPPVADPAPVGPGDLSLFIYTAGTTGPSKGCMLVHNHACNLARQYLANTGRTQDEVAWTALPLFHFNAAATGLLSTLMIGSTLYLATRFSVSGFWPQIESSGARIATLLGSMVTLVASAPDNDSSVRCRGQLRVVRGAPFPAAVQQTWRERFGGEVFGTNGYGLTEACLVTSTDVGDPVRPGAAGRRNTDFEVMVVDDDGRELPTGEAGELVVRPLRPNVMFVGYWRRPEATLDVLRDQWFHTGDLGRFDEDGFYWFVDRKKDYLRRRGENISSAEMEFTFLQHPAVREAAVYGVPSELTEDDVKVSVVLHEGAVVTERELCEWSFDHVPYFAVPRWVQVHPEFPKNPVGRVLKYELKDAHDSATCWDREAAGVVVPR